MFLGYFCSSKGSSKQARQNLVILSYLHCTLYTHKIAEATTNIDNDILDNT